MSTPKEVSKEAARQPSDSERIAALEKALADSQQRVVAMTPQSQVPTNGGGPGVDQHRASWSLAEQEAANAGEWEESE